METELTQTVAEEIAKGLNAMFQNAKLFGAAHPNTRQSARTACELIVPLFGFMQSVTLMRNGESLYIEKWCVDRRIHARSLCGEFLRIGLESLTFLPGLLAEDCELFIGLYGGRVKLGDADALGHAFTEGGGNHIRLNYVTYQKVTADQQILDMGESGEPRTGTVDVPLRQLRDSITQVMTLRDLLQKEETFVGELIHACTREGQGAETGMVEQLRGMAGQIGAGGHDLQSLEQMVEAVCRLRADLTEGLAVQKQMGRILSMESQVVDEVEALTEQAVVQLVREEYRNGEAKPKRLSRLIRRMLPATTDLQKLLPALKTGLIAEGMSIAGFLELVNELRQDLRSDNVSDALKAGAEEIGMSADDILKGISENPGEAARLIVLASEVRHGGSADPEAVSKVMAEYIEKVSGKMAVESQGASAEDGPVLDTLITRIESQFVRRLQSEGVSETVLEKVEEHLRERFPNTFDFVKAEWIQERIAQGKDVSATYLLELLEKVVDDEGKFGQLKEVVERALVNKGYTEQQVRDLLGQVSARVAEAKVQLPKGVLTPRNTAFFLDWQVKLNVRYNLPFTCMMVSVGAVWTGENWVKPAGVALKRIASQLFSLLKETVREVDIVGSFETATGRMPFVLFPMTDLIGALVAKKRLDEVMTAHQFEVQDAPVRIRAVSSITMFEKSHTADVAAYRELLKLRHQKALAAISARPDKAQ